jgi:hypothetical protein
MELDNALDQLGIFPGAPAWVSLPKVPVVIADGGDFQGLAERADGMLGFHRAIPLNSLRGGSEGMSKVFLKFPAVGADSGSGAAGRHSRLSIVKTRVVSEEV